MELRNLWNCETCIVNKKSSHVSKQKITNHTERLRFVHTLVMAKVTPILRYPNIYLEFVKSQNSLH